MSADEPTQPPDRPGPGPVGAGRGHVPLPAVPDRRGRRSADDGAVGPSAARGLVDGQLVHHDHSPVLHRRRVRQRAGGRQAARTGPGVHVLSGFTCAAIGRPVGAVRRLRHRGQHGGGMGGSGRGERRAERAVRPAVVVHRDLPGDRRGGPVHGDAAGSAAVVASGGAGCIGGGGGRLVVRGGRPPGALRQPADRLAVLSPTRHRLSPGLVPARAFVDPGRGDRGRGGHHRGVGLLRRLPGLGHRVGRHTDRQRVAAHRRDGRAGRCAGGRARTAGAGRRGRPASPARRAWPGNGERTRGHHLLVAHTVHRDRWGPAARRLSGAARIDRRAAVSTRCGAGHLPGARAVGAADRTPGVRPDSSPRTESGCRGGARIPLVDDRHRHDLAIRNGAAPEPAGVRGRVAAAGHRDGLARPGGRGFAPNIGGRSPRLASRSKGVLWIRQPGTLPSRSWSPPCSSS